MATPVFESDRIYHVYNRSNGWEMMFSNEDNYRFFLGQFNKYMAPLVETLCYCLMPNHFHLLVRIVNSGDAVRTTGEDIDNSENQLNKELIQQFSNFFNSYARSYNNQQGRKGSLFMQSFKRKPVSDQKYLVKLIHYIHRNPVFAGLCDFPEDWQYSSYKDLVFPGRDELIKLDGDSVVEVYGDLRNFIEMHNREINFEL